MSYAAAKAVLSETQRDRIVAAFFSIENPRINFKKAAEDFGSASQGSFAVMYNTANRQMQAAIAAAAKDGKPLSASDVSPKKRTADGAKLANETTPKTKKSRTHKTTPAKDRSMGVSDGPLSKPILPHEQLDQDDHEGTKDVVKAEPKD